MRKLKNKTKMNLLTILLMLLSIGGVLPIRFDRVDPIIWQDSERFVEDGVTLYDLTLSVGNPCNIIPTSVSQRSQKHISTNDRPGSIQKQSTPTVC